MIDITKIIHTVPQIRTARLAEGKWQVLDTIAHEIVAETKLRHYERVIRELNKGKK
jgi:hypothetical protein